MLRALTIAFFAAASACGARTELGGRLSSEAGADGACETREITLQVSSEAPWVDTGLDVVAGERLVLAASGTVRYGDMGSQSCDANGGNFDGQRFFPTAVLPDAVIVSLIGKVGGTAALDTGVPVAEGTSGDGPGFVGTSYDEIASTSGRLFLGFNDQRQAFGDNSGDFTVTIHVFC